jgi:hypothetical protein
MWVSFLGQPTIWTRQILLGFYPSMQISSQFMSHDWELLVWWKVNSDQNISLGVIENLARTMWLRMMRLYSVYAVFGVVTSLKIWHDKRSTEAVVRDSSERRLVAVSGTRWQLTFYQKFIDFWFYPTNHRIMVPPMITTCKMQTGPSPQRVVRSMTWKCVSEVKPQTRNAPTGRCTPWLRHDADTK